MVAVWGSCASPLPQGPISIPSAVIFPQGRLSRQGRQQNQGAALPGSIVALPGLADMLLPSTNNQQVRKIPSPLVFVIGYWNRKWVIPHVGVDILPCGSISLAVSKATFKYKNMANTIIFDNTWNEFEQLHELKSVETVLVKSIPDREHPATTGHQQQ